MSQPNHISELLALHDAQFVNVAYAVLLKRKPDKEGFDNLLARLRSGHDKGTILVSLATSAEARSINVQLKGLQELIDRRRREDVFILGFFRKLFRVGFGYYYKLNRLENNLGMLSVSACYSDLSEASLKDNVGRDFKVPADLSPRAQEIFNVLALKLIKNNEF